MIHEKIKIVKIAFKIDALPLLQELNPYLFDS
jgi:hypothetical protein